MNFFMRERVIVFFMVAIGILLSTPVVDAQSVVYTKDNMHHLPDQVHTDSRMTDLKYTPKLKGTNYVSDEWLDANILLTGDTIFLEDVNMRMDIVNGVLEIKARDIVKVIPSYKVKSIIVENTGEKFHSRVSINLYGPSGFYRVLYEGKSKLYCHYSSKVKESNYNVALDTGRMDDELVIVKTYYAARKGKLIELEKKKNKLAEQLEGGSKLLDYMKANSIDTKKEKGLIAVMFFMDNSN